MARAGLAAFSLVERLCEQRGPVLVMAGPGNNGGDGFVLATHLKRAAWPVTVAFAGNAADMPSDAAAAFRQWREAGGEVASDFDSGPWAIAVDALFGIGLTRPPAGKYADWIRRFNALACRRLALDIPSGLDAGTGRVLGSAVRATDTLSFIALKPGLLTLDGPDHCGSLHTDTLGLQDAAPQDSGRRIQPADFAEYLTNRPRNSHKGQFGDFAILGGATGMVGAAWIAGRAALVLGAGRVFVAALAVDAPALDPSYPELMMRTPDDINRVASVIAAGPGLGQSEAALSHLKRALSFSGPIVLDADALNLLSAHPGLRALVLSRSAPTVLTPHPAEAARLLDSSTAAIQDDRLRAAKMVSERYHAHVVLKGAGSVVTHPDGTWAINTAGNPGMAAAGMGDALTGIVASLLAQHWPAKMALEAGVHLHGAAADELARSSSGAIGITASEVALAARAVRNRWVGDIARGVRR
ncbi:NAD(P)H-hydrate dehydratase [Niveibacterium umoris]|uniref:ADP-dependent (S)-NAD(P)H-hydrate dehydratase n=1 Tax=Niveibacterium umoris TaxID=1193620 RepID=A0A840BE88_9RHOO|nr:NAD(P)H-hydrate dehydratase [Niveibacterium umoris]MBB4011415.1 hydroxyethylthiazole kinase-like uncharacterized protein yjeF [Niveibacterium umoris]